MNISENGVHTMDPNKSTTNYLHSTNLWRAIGICGLGSLFYLYEFILQVAPSELVNNMMRDLGTDAAGIGIISGIYYLTYTFTQLPAGMLYDRFGAQRVLTVAVGLCCLGAFLFGTGQSLYLVALGRLSMGVGSAFSFIGSLVLIAHWFPPRYFAMLAGFSQSLSSVGAVIGTAPLGSAVAMWGWRKTIMLLALVGLVLMLLVGLFVKDSPNGRVHESKHIDWRGMAANFGTVCKTKQTWWIGLYAFCSWAPVVMFAALWGSSCIKSICGVSDFTASLSVDMIWVGIGFASPFIGWWSDKIKRRIMPLVLVSITGIVCGMVVMYVPHLPIHLVYVLMLGIGIAAGGQSLSFALINDNNSKSLVGTAVGINNMFVVLGGLLLQPLGGLLLKLHWDGTLIENIPSYTASDFRFALGILPFFYVVSALTAYFKIKETHAVSQTL